MAGIFIIINCAFMALHMMSGYLCKALKKEIQFCIFLSDSEKIRVQQIHVKRFVELLFLV